MAKKRNFEDFLGEVEEVVTALEQGRLTLDESLVAYERGRKSLVACTKILDEAEKKVEILLADGGANGSANGSANGGANNKGGRKAEPFPEEKGGV